MSHAAMRAGRDPASVRLVAVSKGVEVEAIRKAVDAGQRVFGESRVQEAMAKAERLKGERVELHMIGHLQRNKARQAVGLFGLIQTVDGEGLLRLIDRLAAEAGRRQAVLLQVKLSEEAAKTGASGEELERMMECSAALGNVEVRGLMGMVPYREDPCEARPYFERLRDLAERYGLRELSMGMSHDFEVAIEEGATLVRVGGAIFGQRGDFRR